MQTLIQTHDEFKPNNWFKLSHFDEKLKHAETKDQTERNIQAEKILKDKNYF